MKGMSFIRPAPTQINKADMKRQISYDFEECSPNIKRRVTMPFRNSHAGAGASIVGLSGASLETSSALRHGADQSMRMWKVGATLRTGRPEVKDQLTKSQNNVYSIKQDKLNALLKANNENYNHNNNNK